MNIGVVFLLLGTAGIFLLRRVVDETTDYQEEAAQDSSRINSNLADDVALQNSIDDLDSNDVESLARMFASENPSQPVETWYEQGWTQIRNAEDKGRTIYDQITAGNGFGSQGERNNAKNRRRPVSTAKTATQHTTSAAKDLLNVEYKSKFPKAMRFWEPGQQDAAFKVAERARAKQKTGETLTAQEKRLLLYKYDANGIRKLWRERDHSELVGSMGPVEFWT